MAKDARKTFLGATELEVVHRLPIISKALGMTACFYAYMHMHTRTLSRACARAHTQAHAHAHSFTRMRTHTLFFFLVAFLFSTVAILIGFHLQGGSQCNRGDRIRSPTAARWAPPF